MNETRLIILELERELRNYLLQNKKKVQYDILLESTAFDLLKEAVFFEKEISQNVLKLQDGTTSFFVDFAERFKNYERLCKKIIDKMQTNHETLDEAASNIGDVLRYTLIVNDNEYLSKIKECLTLLRNDGYRILKFKNTWNSDVYKSINVIFITDIGFKFEIQFHTPHSYAIKEGKLRYAYEVVRDPNAPEEIVNKANKVRKYYQSTVEVPYGASEYKYENEKQLQKMM